MAVHQDAEFIWLREQPPTPEPVRARVPPWGADGWAAGSHPGCRTRTAFLSLGVSALCARGFVLSSPWSWGDSSQGPSGRSGSHLCALGRGVDMNLASEEAGARKCSRAKTSPDRTAWPSAQPASPAPQGGSHEGCRWSGSLRASWMHRFSAPTPLGRWQGQVLSAGLSASPVAPGPPILEPQRGHGGWCFCLLENVLGSHQAHVISGSVESI